MIGSGAGRARARVLVAAAAMALAGTIGEDVAGAGPPAEPPRAAPANAGTTIGVLYFDYAGKNAELAPLSKGLAQMLISDLAAVDTVLVVERERLQAVLDEQKLGESWKKSGKLDSRTAARIGKLLGARYLVLGTYFDAVGAFRADARLVDVETGQIVKSIGANGKAEDFISLEQILADGLCKAVAQLPSPPGSDHAEHKDAEHGGGEHGVARPPVRRIPKPPRGLKASTAVTYGKALAAADVGDRRQAQTLFKSVLAEQPDFELAQRDLDKLIQ
jgi:TolB-like protein